MFENSKVGRVVGSGVGQGCGRGAQGVERGVRALAIRQRRESSGRSV